MSDDLDAILAALIAEGFGLPFAARSRDYPNDDALRVADIQAHQDSRDALRRALAGRLLPEGGETRTEWGATIGAPSGYFVQPQHVRLHRDTAESEVEALAEDTADLVAAAVLVRREIRTFADKSTFVGPWVAVDQEVTDA